MFRGVFRNTKLWVLRDHITFWGWWGGRLPNIIGNLSRWRFGVCNTRFRILILGSKEYTIKFPKSFSAIDNSKRN